MGYFKKIALLLAIIIAGMAAWIQYTIPQVVIDIHVQLVKDKVSEIASAYLGVQASSIVVNKVKDEAKVVEKQDGAKKEAVSSNNPNVVETLEDGAKKEAVRYNLCVEELKKYDGTDDSLPILLSVGGKIFDVTPGAQFYGKDGHYKMFAGCACTRALAISSLDEEDWNDNVDDVDPMKIQATVDFYSKKYAIVGKLSDTCG